MFAAIVGGGSGKTSRRVKKKPLFDGARRGAAIKLLTSLL
jgi:hypothetical protein